MDMKQLKSNERQHSLVFLYHVDCPVDKGDSPRDQSCQQKNY